MVVLYHYTDDKGKRGIERDRTIRYNTKREHHFGPGVYFTSLSPDIYSNQEIARNNYRIGKYWGNKRKTETKAYTGIETFICSETETKSENVLTLPFFLLSLSLSLSFSLCVCASRFLFQDTYRNKFNCTDTHTQFLSLLPVKSVRQEGTTCLLWPMSTVQIFTRTF